MTLDNWGEVSDSFDKKKKKLIGIEPAAKNDGVDMFEQAGVAAE
jgi:ribonucleoside-diphosphate reductase beta chain